jgi:heat shock protein HslJ
MKSLVYIVSIILFTPVISKAQEGLKGNWKILKVVDVVTDNELFSDLQKRGTLVFTDSVISGRATCNDFEGYYKATGEYIKTREVKMTLKGCGKEEELEGKILTIIKKTFSYKIVNDTLAITDNSTSKLMYVKEE